MLKNYNERKDEKQTKSEKEDLRITANANVLLTKIQQA